MPTNWDTMGELPRSVVLPSVRRRIVAGTLTSFGFGFALMVWGTFEKTFVWAMLQILMFPYTLLLRILAYCPPYEAGSDGMRSSVLAGHVEGAGQAALAMGEASIGRLVSSQVEGAVFSMFALLLAAWIHVHVCRYVRLALLSDAGGNAPYLIQRTLLSVILSWVACHAAFSFVYSRISAPPSGDSKGGLEAFLFMFSETLEMVAIQLQTILQQTTRLELRLISSTITSGVVSQVDSAWDAIPLLDAWPLRDYARHLKASMWISVAISALDLLLLTVGDGRRVVDHVMGCRLFMGRLEGAGTNEAWQYWTPTDLVARLGIVVALISNEWHISAVVMLPLLAYPYVSYFVTAGLKKMNLSKGNPRRDLLLDQTQRRVREEQQLRAAEMAAKRIAEGTAPASTKGPLSLADRAEKYAPGVYKALAGHDWHAAGEGTSSSDQAAGAAGEGLRRRKQEKPAQEPGTVWALTSIQDWKGMRDVSAKPAGLPYAVLYVSDAGALATRQASEALAAAARDHKDKVLVGRMEVEGKLDDLAGEGVRFSGRFPVLCVYQGKAKINQVMGARPEDVAAVLAQLPPPGQGAATKGVASSQGAASRQGGASSQGGGSGTVGGAGGSPSGTVGAARGAVKSPGGAAASSSSGAMVIFAKTLAGKSISLKVILHPKPSRLDPLTPLPPASLSPTERPPRLSSRLH
ncbi:hypothetical protein T484DRAFT_2573562 [Baffinella frigidus]|nr:hypothetical protein T484DRAFT_2573562 [Cryptophyta sp. CCMP2293]